MLVLQKTPYSVNVTWLLDLFSRALIGFDRVCRVWRSLGLLEKEPRTQWHLFQRPGYQASNKSDVRTTDEVCLANCWWNELLVIKICKSKDLSAIRYELWKTRKYYEKRHRHWVIKIPVQDKQKAMPTILIETYARVLINKWIN